MFHVNPPTENHRQLFEWVVKGWEDLPADIPSDALAQIWWYEWLKRNPILRILSDVKLIKL
ncbi:hypothetical protein [Trichormus sp. NMC-1]|uniref:hypothetical protein n=1 Tax=Trichormus sp. NMC-1 TaxID=1853259 RepID=UPI0008DC1943|nr:hypothetical protein [Trichormus sp. NMC-1]